jgi:hypothetical protein
MYQGYSNASAPLTHLYLCGILESLQMPLELILVRGARTTN